MKGFKDKNKKFHPISNKKGVTRRKREPFDVTRDGVKLSQRQLIQMQRAGIGRRKRFTNPKIQTLIFPSSLFTVTEAKKWARFHGYIADKVDVKENSIRIRQISPSQIKQGKENCATIKLGRGAVQAVLCDVIRKKRDDLFRIKLTNPNNSRENLTYSVFADNEKEAIKQVKEKHLNEEGRTKLTKVTVARR